MSTIQKEKTSEEYRIYDSIIASILEQMKSIQANNNTKKNILFYYEDNEDNKMVCDFVLKLCFMYEDLYHSPVYIYTNILTYFKLKIKYFHKRKIKWANIRRLFPIIWPTSISYDACDKFKQSYTIIKEIYQEYYE